jgi:hypothetical protein
MLSTISNGVKRYPLVTFFVLAYALTLVFLPEDRRGLSDRPRPDHL